MHYGRIFGKKRPTEYDKAEEYILKDIESSDQLKLRPYFTQGYLYLGDLYSDMGRTAEAKKYLAMAEAAFAEMEMLYWVGKTREVLERVK